jgi:hypothetical protein
MNIFVTSPDPVESAVNLDDKRVIKMILESAQMLSTAMVVHNGPGPYKITHKNHPCTVWARTTSANYKWLYDHYVALMDEYTYRYGKKHACEGISYLLAKGEQLVPQGDLTPFANCSLFKELDVVEAYQRTMNHKWHNDKRPAYWKKRLPPPWKM